MTSICVYCGGNAQSGCGAIEREGGRFEHYSKIECAEVLRKAVEWYRSCLEYIATTRPQLSGDEKRWAWEALSHQKLSLSMPDGLGKVEPSDSSKR